MKPLAQRVPRFSLTFLLVALTILAIALFSWRIMSRRTVFVRPLSSVDSAPVALLERSEPRAEALAIFECDPGRDTEIELTLVALRNGTVTEIETLVVAHQPLDTVTDDPFGAPDHKVLVSLLTDDGFTPHRIALKVVGISTTRSVSYRHDVAFARKFSSTLRGTLQQGSRQIIHAEGDMPVAVGRKTRLGQFAASNDGNYLLVLARLN